MLMLREIHGFAASYRCMYRDALLSLVRATINLSRCAFGRWDRKWICAGDKQCCAVYAGGCQRCAVDRQLR